MPDRHTPDAGDDTLREQLAEAIESELRAHPTISATPSNPGVIGTFGGMSPHELADALLPRISEHVAAAVQAERERVGALLASVPDTHYPTDVFGGPFSTDESRMANEALKECSLTIDRISANVMRHAYRVAAAMAVKEPDDA